MLFNCKQTDSGIKISLNNKNFNLVYSQNIWKKYPQKEFLFDNLNYLLTAPSSFITNTNVMEYNTSKPLLKNEFKKSIIKEIPHSAEDYKKSAKETIKKFKQVKSKFKDNKIKLPHCPNTKLNERALIPFSLGKDSMLTLAVAHELKLNPIMHYINDTVSPSENRIKISFTKKISKEFNLKYYITKNSIEAINDFEFWNKPETTLGYSHMIYSFALISLPIMHKHRCKYLLFGNEQNLNFKFKTKEGILTFPSPNQTSKSTLILDKTIKRITGNKAKAASLIEPLTHLAIMKILHTRYKKFGKYQISCDSLDASHQKRWCQNGDMCSDMYLQMKALNINPKTVNFKTNMFNKKFFKYYSLFHPKKASCYDKTPQARDQQLLAFYLAYKNKAKGYAIEKFRKRFLKEAQEREDELYKKFFKVYPALTLTPKLRKAVNSIYKEELGKL